MKLGIRRVGITLLVGFVAIALALSYWQVIKAGDLTGDARYNGFRLNERDKSVQRGRILDRNGAVLVESKPGESKRVYTAPWLVHVTGFHSAIYGDTNIEAQFGDYLSGAAGADPFKAVADDLLHRPRVGSDVVLTIDSEIQEVAEKAMGPLSGAVVVLQPKTGEVLALVSHPFFDPNRVEKDWPNISTASGAPLLNRATQGLYTPGSTFKTITLAAALDSGITSASEVFDYEVGTDGSGRSFHTLNVNGYEVYCANHGSPPPGQLELALPEAYAASCNVTFAKLGLRLGAQRLTDYARRFGLGNEIPLGIASTASRLSNAPNLLNDPASLAATSFGQGQLAVTPLQMAEVAATIARGGTAPQPYLVKQIRGGSSTREIGQPRDWQRAISPETAKQVTEMMVQAVENGWASGAKIPGVRVAGKTGTAEVGPGRAPHAVFVGFAPADDPVVAVAVVKENAGAGSVEAVPTGKAIMEAVLSRGQH
ncbi:MAG: penicillin-binding protein 2 [Chloroflexi bacterium]|nr:penicillin-binding protein 2 [Chloroflexota bacterium]